MSHPVRLLVPHDRLRSDDQTQPGGFYRVRYTGRPVHLPVELKATKSGISMTFSGSLDPKSVADLENYAIKTWSLKRTAGYGSKHYDEKPAKLTSAKLSADGKTVTLAIADMAPTWCMEIRYAIRSTEGLDIRGVVHNTVNTLPKD